MKGLSLKPRLDLGVSGEVGSIHKSFWEKKQKRERKGGGERGRRRDINFRIYYNGLLVKVRIRVRVR